MSAPVSKTVNIYINQASAEASLEKLQKRADALNKSIERGRQSGKDMTSELQKLDTVNKSIETLSKQLDGRMAPSLNQVKRYATDLRRELEGMSADAPGYAEKFAKFKEVNEHFKTLKAELDNVNKALQAEPEESSGILGWLNDFKDQIKTVAIGTVLGNTMQAAFDKITGYFGGIIGNAAKLSDALADVSKSTGMTDEEVKKLNASLGKIDTRTKTAELREMAIGLGQIGEAATPEAIANIDKIVVALGDEFGGGAKEITTTLGVLRNNLQDIKTGNYGEDVLHIGNALNVLGSEGLASAPVVTNIANRIAGLAQTFGVTSGQILGTAATFQELGIEAERGSSAYTKILQDMTTNTAAFAKVAGMDVESFTNLVNTDITAALIKVAEGTKKAGDGNVAFGKILKTLNADGSGAGELLSKLASNSELLTKKINLASGALLETSSITEEFNKKNTDLAAQIEKLGKVFDKLVSSSLINGFIVNLVSVTATAVKWLASLSEIVTKNSLAFIGFAAAAVLQSGVLIRLKDAIALATVGTAELTGATIIATLAERADIIATSALGVVKAILTLNIKRLRQEWMLLSAAMGVNPWVLAIVVAASAYLAYKNLTDQTVKLTKAQEDQKRIQETITSNASRELGELEALRAKIAQVAFGIEYRTEAARKLQQLYPQIFGNLTTEQILAGNVADAYTRATKAIIAKAAAGTFTDELGKVSAQIAKLDKEITSIAAKKGIELFKVPSINGTPSGYQFDASLGITAGLLKRIQEYNALIASQQQLVGDLTKTQDDINASGKENEKNTNKQVVTLESLKAKLKALQDLRESIAISDKAGLAENLKQIQDLQTQIAAIDGKTTTEDRKEETQARKLAAFKQKIAALRGEVAAAAKDYEANKNNKAYELEIQKVKDKYAALLIEGKKYAADVAQLSELERQELDLLFKKQFDDRSAHEYEESLKNLSDYYNQQKQRAGEAYASQEITREQHSSRMHQLEVDEATDRARIAEDYSGTVKKAAEAAEGAKTVATQKGVQDRKALDELEAADRIAALQRNVAISPAGSRQQLTARADLLRAQNDIEIQALKDRYAQQGIVIDDNNAQVKAKQAELNSQLKQLDNQYAQDKIQKIEQVASEIGKGFASVLSMLNANDQAALAKDQKANTTKKAQYQAMLDSKQISQATYNKMVQQLDEQLDKKQQEINRKKAARDKATAIFEAVISTAAAVAGQLAMKPVGPWNIALAAVMGALGGVQIATIAAQKTPTYATGRRPVGDGGIAEGASHADGGIKMVDSRTGKVVGEMEGDEAIISKKTVQNNPELANALLDSSMKMGGARINPMVYALPTPINTARVSEAVNYTRMYANGGWVNGQSGGGTGGGSSSSGNYNADMVAAMNGFTEGLKKGVTANLIWTQFQEMQRQYDQIKSSGSMGG